MRTRRWRRAGPSRTVCLIRTPSQARLDSKSPSGPGVLHNCTRSEKQQAAPLYVVLVIGGIPPLATANARDAPRVS